MVQHILAYHGFREGLTPELNAGSVRIDRFRHQCRVLSAHGWQAQPLHDVAPDVKSGRKSRLVLTVDDGYESVLTLMVPVCERFGWKGTLFIPSAFAGRNGAWDRGSLASYRHLSWSQLRELLHLGWEIGSHGVSHRALTDMPGAEAFRELRDSRQEIEQRLGVAVTSISYPFGAVNSCVRSLAHRAGYRRGVTMAPRGAEPDDDRFMLPRWPVYRVDGPENLLARLHGPEWLRQLERAKVWTMQQFARGTRVVMAK